MRLIASMSARDAVRSEVPGALAYLTHTASGCLVGLVLEGKGRRLVASHHGQETSAVPERQLRRRIDALRTRLASATAGSPSTATHVHDAAHALERSFLRHPRDEPTLSARQLEIARAMLGSGLGEAVYITDVARACQLSEGHFRRAFRTCTGLSPQQWRQERRIAYCRQLLVETDEPLALVSRSAGFAAQSHFSRVFTQLTLMSPTEWRRLFRPAARVGSLDDVPCSTTPSLATAGGP